MNKTIISAAFALAALFTSCSDFLDEDVRGRQNLNTYFQTEEECEAFVTGCYNAITFNDWWQVNTVWLLSEMCSDDGWMGNTTQDPSDYLSLAHYQGTGQSNGAISNFWQHRYKGIMRCNVAIQRISKSELSDKKLQERLVGEARFLRAYFYFELVRNFGGVPLVTDFFMPDEIQGIERSTTADVYAFIEEDLKAAAEMLPLRSEQSASEIGRATRGAAQGLLGKVYLYQEKWSEAEGVLSQVISSNEYDLMPDFGDVWDTDHNNNIESLFEVQFTYDGTYNIGGALTVITGARNGPGDGWSWGQPTANLEQAFIDAGDTERLRWTIIKTGCTEIAGENNFNEFISNSKDDKYNSMREKFGWSDDCYIINPDEHKSARVVRKYFVPLAKRPEVYNINKIPLDHRILRYADVLLMYAEACNEMGGKDGEALNALNKVRERAKLAAVSVTGNDLRKAIRSERRLELAWEQNRLYDIRRWTDDNGKKMICNIMGPNGSFVKYNTDETTRDIYEWYNQREKSNKGETFDENRDMVFPIPLYEITMSNGSIKQNPGWN